MTRLPGRTGWVRLELPHRHDGPGARLGYQHDGATFIAEGPAQRADKILRVSFRKQFVAVDEQQKRRGRLFHLRGVKKLEPMPQRAAGLLSFDGVVERAVEERGRDFLLQLSGAEIGSLHSQSSEWAPRWRLPRNYCVGCRG